MYTNPIIPGVNPDPSICRVDPGTGVAETGYYLAASTFALVPGVPIYYSCDLVNWRLVGHALTRPEHFCLDKTSAHPEIYAPTLRYHHGTFYMVTTNVHGGGNFYVTASNPAGPWSDPIFIDDGAFDPSLFFDDDGKVYYTRRGPFSSKDIVQAEIDLQTGRLLTPLRSISLGLVSDDAEGPHLYKINGWYYLMIAEGGTMYLHMETIARSRSPWGPFQPCPWNPILAQHHAWWHPVRSTGHADLVEAHDGSWWMVFLATRHASYPALNIIGRESFLAPVHWQDGWPVVDSRATRSLEVDVPTLPLHPMDNDTTRVEFGLNLSPSLLGREPGTEVQPFSPSPTGRGIGRTSFARGEGLGSKWVSTSFPQPTWFDLSSRPGCLRLWGQPDQPAEGKPAAFFAQRQTAFHSRAQTMLEFDPAAEHEEAGMTLFMSGDYQYQLAVSQRQGQRVVLLRRRVGDITQEAFATALPPGPICLQVISEPETYTFSWSQPGGQWQTISSALTRLLCTELARSWSGLLIGLYASGNGHLSTRPADFDWFDYIPDNRSIAPFY